MVDFPTSITSLKRAVNNLKHDLTSDISDSLGVIEATATTGAPDSGSFHIDQEIIYYPAKTATTYGTGGSPCLRGQDGTAAAIHLKSAGGEVKFGPEAHYHNDAANEIEAIEAKVGVTSSAVTTSHDYKLSGVTTGNKAVSNAGNETIAGIKTFSSSPIVPTPTTDYQASTKLYADGIKTALKANEIIIMAAGFNINGSSATLVDTAGTAAKCYVQHISALKTYWLDVPKFPVPADYDGGNIDISVTFKSAASAKTHSMGIRVASVATGSPCNPDLAVAYQLYNAEASDATAGDIKVKTVTVTQANHLMVAGQDWHCKFVIEDDGECDADAVLIEKVRIKWNKA